MHHHEASPAEALAPGLIAMLERIADRGHAGPATKYGQESIAQLAALERRNLVSRGKDLKGRLMFVLTLDGEAWVRAWRYAKATGRVKDTPIFS